MTTLYIWIVVWIASSLVATGWFFAYIQGSFPGLAQEHWRDDMGHSALNGMLCGLFGPIGILLCWLLTGFAQHGWRLRPTVEAK